MNIALVSDHRPELTETQIGALPDGHRPELLVYPRERGAPGPISGNREILELSPRVGGGFLLVGPSEVLELPDSGILPIHTVATGTSSNSESGFGSEKPTRLYYARVSDPGTLAPRVEEERDGLAAILLWNDLPFNVTQCALEIEALELSRHIGVPVFWLSTQWAGRPAFELHRRGFWVSNSYGEIVRSEFRHDFPNELFDVTALGESSAVATLSSGALKAVCSSGTLG